MAENELLTSIESLHAKIDRVLELLTAAQRQNVTVSARRSPKQKAAPLTQEEASLLEVKFNDLYRRWLGGQEIEVQSELEQLDVEQLRRMGDSNNLNVTSKMPKGKLLYLISARFREKKQLHKGAGSPEAQGS